MEALYLDCGARRPQLKRNPLGGHVTMNLPKQRTLTLLALAFNVAIRVSAQDRSPPDRPVSVDSAASACLDSAIGPLIAKAHASFPDFVGKLQAGLPPGHRPAVTVRLQDTLGHYEQIFVAVDSVQRDSVYGRINSDISFVQGYRYGQPFEIPVSQILDWTISHPDGSEEGNLIGKFMDDLQDRLHRSPQRKPC